MCATVCMEEEPSLLTCPLMLYTVYLTVQALAEDTSTYVVIMEGAGEKAFCAGGDIRGLYSVRSCIYKCMLWKFDILPH